MQIVIPMSGYGERFRRAGYRMPKPLIEVEGKPIIAHVIDLFPGETDFVFVCNREHLETPGYDMAGQLARHCPSGRIVGIEPHKLGPVHAVLQAIDALDPRAPTIVNYCDFACSWDWNDFREAVSESGCDGAIPCYTGFHPHMLGSTNYAYVRSERGRVLAIQEKQPYTDTPSREYASSGTYYFASGALMRDAFARTRMRPELSLSGEYYASLAYRPLLEDGARVMVYPLQHFMQWGTPQDLEEYRYWSDAFRGLCTAGTTPRQRGAVMVPMAGLGERFARENYARPKPLIEVSGEPMAVQAARDLPVPERRVFVQRRDADAGIAQALAARFPGCTQVMLEQPTDGQARTCLLGLDAAGPGVVDPDAPLTIGACDNGAVFDAKALAARLDDPAIDVLVWVARGYPGAMRRPDHYGWVDVDGDRVRAVSVKRPLADPARDPVVLGTFHFRRARDFAAAAQAMIARGGRVNGEFYVDTCINDAVAMGLDCRIFEVAHYLCWGTPDDLRTFEYWQSCFHNWPSHPYRLECDPHVSPQARGALARRYAPPAPERPAW